MFMSKGVWAIQVSPAKGTVTGGFSRKGQECTERRAHETKRGHQ